MFKKYMHIEKFGNDEVQGIELGKCFIFPKLDGSNGSLWFEADKIKAGSRNRELTLDNDNQGFYEYILNGQKKDNFKDFLNDYPHLRLFGEWLVPHSLKVYEDNAWRKFYIFDVFDDKEQEYLSYHSYKTLLDLYQLDYIPPISTVINATYDNFLIELKNNGFLIPDGKGEGEGIVIKNYQYQNRYGRLCFAKIVTNAFKEKMTKAQGPTEKLFNKMTEQKIIDKWCDNHLIEKVYAKIVNENEGWNSKYIPRFFNEVYHDLVAEELWDIVKNLKQPTINFKTLQLLVILKIKEVKPELF